MLKCNNIQPILELKMNWEINMSFQIVNISFQIVHTAVYGIFTKYNEWLGVFGSFFVICNLLFCHLLFLFYCMTEKHSWYSVDIKHWKKNVWILLSLQLCCWCLLIWSDLVSARNGVWYVRNTAWTFDMKKDGLYILRKNSWHSSRFMIIGTDIK